MEPPAGHWRQEVKSKLVVKTPGTAQPLRCEIAGEAEEEREWCDVRRHLARRGGGAGGSGGVEQLLPDSKEGELTAMTRPPPRGERDEGNQEAPQDFRKDFDIYRNGIREGRHNPRGGCEEPEYNTHRQRYTPSTSALANNPVSCPFFH